MFLFYPCFHTEDERMFVFVLTVKFRKETKIMLSLQNIEQAGQLEIIQAPNKSLLKDKIY